MNDAPAPAEAEAESAKLEACSNLSYADVCETLDAISTTAGAAKKLEMLFSGARSRVVGQQSWYPLVRLVVPVIDCHRKNYGLKVKTLAKVYAAAINLTKGGADGAKLAYHAGDPDARAEFVSPELALTVQAILEKRTAKKRSEATLAEVNRFLDAVTATKGSPAKACNDLFARHIDSFAPREHAWIVRIILGEVKIGLKENAIFKCMHRAAVTSYATCSDLRRVCAEFASDGPGQKKIPDDEAANFTLEVGEPFAPMVCLGFPKAPDQVAIVEQALSGGKKKKGADPADVPPGFIVDEKLDGERLIVHKVGKEFKMYSRKTNECSRIYSVLTAELGRRLSKLRDCILDGEVTTIDRHSKRPLPFGNNKAVAKIEQFRQSFPDTADEAILQRKEIMPLTVHNAIESQHLLDARIEFIVYDVVYVDDDDESVMQALLGHRAKEKGCITHFTLGERRKILGRLIEDGVAAAPAAAAGVWAYDDRQRLRIVKHVLVERGEPTEARRTALRDLYESVVAAGGEGVVAKRLDAPYLGGDYNRARGGWYKLKPDYEGGTPTIDAVIVGAYWSEASQGPRKGKLTQFVLGALSVHRRVDAGCIVTVGKVGSGIDAVMLEKILGKLEGNLAPFEANKIPNYLDPRRVSDDRPDLIVCDITKSVVLEMKVSELTPSKFFSAGFTWRFPRCEQLRGDKAWDQIVTAIELREIFHQPRKVLPTKTSKKGNAPPKAPKRKVGFRDDEIIDQAALLQLAQGEVSLFVGETFLVLNSAQLDIGGATLNAKAVRDLIAKHGGSVVAAAPKAAAREGPQVVVIDSPDRNAAVIKIYRENGLFSVVDVGWIKRCVEGLKHVDRGPRDYICASRDDVSALRRSYDRVWGDHLFEPTTKETLAAARAAAAAQRPSSLYQDMTPSRDDEADWSSEIRTPKRCLRGVTAPLAFRLRYYGAKISAALDSSVTHVVVEAPLDGAPPAAHVVNPSWVEDSIRQHSTLEPTAAHTAFGAAPPETGPGAPDRPQPPDEDDQYD
ncbi:ATP dependent DNA ligase domain-containing protein [Pelagophyceae sp. CCMP2097]|nr:ATP dependent DNA ligase domain-containing protein [Pelagophyceae sp. CCMP2097]